MKPYLLALYCSALLFAGCVGPKDKAAPDKVLLAEKGARPAINKRFRDPKLDLRWAKRTFEGESREIFAQKHLVAKVLELEKGTAVADIGAGTGLFLPFFTKGVGTTGTVYAVEIAPRFIEHLRDLSKKKGWNQVQTVFCTDRSTKLEKGSIDTAFICDTYHHFEYPRSTLRSLHDAMKPGGRLVIVDFERIPGKSRKWILGHVRCGKKTVIEEVESTGFVFEDEVQVRGLRENYVIRFRRE